MPDSHQGPDDTRQWNALLAEAAKLAADDYALLAEAAKLAADDIRDSDDPHQRQLRAALDEIHARLSADGDDAPV